jgi:hypothetical protein
MNEDQRLECGLRELAEALRRFGYCRRQIPLQREGWQVNRKGVYRLYVEANLALMRKLGRKRRSTCALGAAEGSGSQPGVVGGLHDRCAQLRTEVSYLENRG